MAVRFVILLNREQFLALLGMGAAQPDLSLRFKSDYRGAWYGLAVVLAALLFAVAPFVEELWRCLRRAPVPAQATGRAKPRRAPTDTAG